jgi:hypothetical protein
VACANLAEAVAMSSKVLDLIPNGSGGRWFCVMERGGLKIGVELMEESPGGGDWSVVGTEVRPVSGALTVAMLRDAPYGDAVRVARAEILKTVQARKPFVSPSDPPAAFRADRRGRSPRTDDDFALLASAYLALGKGSRQHAAAHWAERWPEGGTKGTWSNRLVRAKKFVETILWDGKDEEVLTDEGMARVYGAGWASDLEFERKWDSALNIATMQPGSGPWRRLQRDGKDPREWQRAAQKTIRVDVNGIPFPIDSPETPQ